MPRCRPRCWRPSSEGSTFSPSSWSISRTDVRLRHDCSARCAGRSILFIKVTLMKKNERSLVPSGMATILPHAAQRVRQLETALLGTLARWGYQESIAPTFEYLDVLSPGLEPDVIEQCYK